MHGAHGEKEAHDDGLVGKGLEELLSTLEWCRTPKCYVKKIYFNTFMFKYFCQLKVIRFDDDVNN
jgi:hypothetical protein